jgi:hypothetical protein
MPSFLCVCLDYLVTEFKAFDYIDGIPASFFKDVNYAAISVSEVFLHDIEINFTNIKLLHHFVFIEKWIEVVGLVGVTDNGLKQYESFVFDLLYILHVSPLEPSITWCQPVMKDTVCPA